MHGHDVEGVIQPDLELQPDGERADRPGHRADQDGADGVDEPAGGSDGDQASHRARGGAERGGVPVPDALDQQPAKQRRTRCQQRVGPGQPCRGVGREFRARVEPEPAEPQQPRSEHHEGQVVRADIRVLHEAEALAQNHGQHEARDAGVHVHDGSAGEVEGRDLAADDAGGAEDSAAPDPVGDRRVDKRHPQRGEEQPGAEPDAFGDRPADQGDGDDGERGLETDEHHVRQAGSLAADAAGQPAQAEVGEGVPDESAEGIGPERHAVAPQGPDDGDDAHGAEAHHHDVQDGFHSHESAVEEREAGSHEEDEGGRCQHPRRRARIERLGIYCHSYCKHRHVHCGSLPRVMALQRAPNRRVHFNCGRLHVPRR